MGPVYSEDPAYIPSRKKEINERGSARGNSQIISYLDEFDPYIRCTLVAAIYAELGNMFVRQYTGIGCSQAPDFPYRSTRVQVHKIVSNFVN